MFSFGLLNTFPRFSTEYYCYSVSMMPGNERDDVERGGKIILPQSALEHLTRLNVFYPMQFKITNLALKRITHCGVLEFVADEGRCYLPHWMMKNLMLEEGEMVHIENVNLPVANFSKFQPQSTDFLDITNPKAVLENCLRTFSCLTTGDVINLKYNHKDYELCVLETKPNNAVSIVECDMNVEFAPPVGYISPEENVHAHSSHTDDIRGEHDYSNIGDNNSETDDAGLVIFSGKGHRLDGKENSSGSTSEETVMPRRQEITIGIPDYDWQVGTLTFMRNVKKVQKVNEDSVAKPFTPFTGTGNQLRSTRPKCNK